MLIAVGGQNGILVASECVARASARAFVIINLILILSHFSVDGAAQKARN